MSETHRCYNCGKITNILQCSKCASTTYCSKECQIHDWKNGHKTVCATSRKNKLKQEMVAKTFTCISKN